MSIFTIIAVEKRHKWECIAPGGFYFWRCVRCGETAPYPDKDGEKNTECPKAE